MLVSRHILWKMSACLSLASHQMVNLSRCSKMMHTQSYPQLMHTQSYPQADVLVEQKFFSLLPDESMVFLNQKYLVSASFANLCHPKFHHDIYVEVKFPVRSVHYFCDDVRKFSAINSNIAILRWSSTCYVSQIVIYHSSKILRYYHHLYFYKV